MDQIRLSTEYECLVVASDFQHLLLTNESLIITKHDQIFIYPSSKQILPFKIDFENHNHSNYRIIEAEGSYFCHLFLANKIKKSAIETIVVSGENVKININESDICFCLKENEYNLPLSFKTTKYEIKNLENFIFVILKNHNSEMLIAFNVKTKSFYVTSGKDFVLKDKKIKFIQEYKDFAKSTVYKTLYFSDNKVNEECEKIDYKKFNYNEENICFLFLECIKEKNFILAKTFMQNHEISETQLSSFFDKFLSFFPISSTKFILIFQNSTKAVTFELSNNKITDFNM